MKKVVCLLTVLAALGLGCVCAQAETTTTVLMYMCGTDLQEDCVRDIYEMCAVPLPDSINIVIQAGGASEWADSDLTPNAINRFSIEDQGFSEVEVLRGDSMGAQSTLYSFLEWAVPSYPADRYMLVLWDHGGGSDAGICFDETADFDSLTTHEIYDALYDYGKVNEDFHLDILGCDACLMATYEVAAHISPYASYLVASEELEPWLGWNYTGWLEKLAEDPDMDSQSIAVNIADAYMEACMEDDPTSYYSLSVIYLPAMGQVKEYMETYASYLAETLENGQLAAISRARQRMYSFGSYYEGGSTNMVDFMAFLDGTRQFAPNQAQMVENAYKRAVRYNLGTENFDYLTGLTILMPSGDVSDFISGFNTNYDCGETIPNYVQFAYGYATMLSGSNYVFSMDKPTQLDSALAAQTTFTGNMTATMLPNATYVATADSEVDVNAEIEDVTVDLPEVQSNADFDGVFTGVIMPVQSETGETFVEATSGETAYACSMTLSADELANLGLAEGLLYMDASDEEDAIYIEMGTMQNVSINWETGEIVSGFDGTWPMLDEQIVTMYDLIVTGSLRRSMIPVKCNDEAGYLIMTFTTANPSGVCAGFTQGFDEQGLPVRGTTKLKSGDVVVPQYSGLYEDESGEMQEMDFEGDPITVGSSGTIPFEFLPLEGSETGYLYCFCLTDIFGEEQLSDFISFTL